MVGKTRLLTETAKQTMGIRLVWTNFNSQWLLNLLFNLFHRLVRLVFCCLQRQVTITFDHFSELVSRRLL